MPELTETHKEILFNAWALHARSRGFVPTDDAIEVCEELREAGWLKRLTLENGDPSYWWTPQAELALDLNELFESVEGRQN